MSTISDSTAPVVTGLPQAQGDLVILPWPAEANGPRRRVDAAKAQPLAAPVVVLTGRDGHDHALKATAGVAWFGYPGGRQTLGVLSVADGSVATLEHGEHGQSRVGPGVYVIRRQREQADEIRFVQD